MRESEGCDTLCLLFYLVAVSALDKEHHDGAADRVVRDTLTFFSHNQIPEWCLSISLPVGRLCFK